ncbi:MAG: hypothetical protein RIE08_18500 [Acidimicrobiales bacterium]
MTRNSPSPHDEHRHVADGSPRWSERIALSATSDDERTGVSIDWIVADAQGRGAIDVRLTRAGFPLVVVVDDDLPAASKGRFELRAPALWVDLVVETPLAHVTLGLEAFGVAVGEGADVGPDVRGDRTPLGLDLEWETSAPPGTIVGGYAIPCRVHGEVLVADGAVEVTGKGARSHMWGSAAGPEPGTATP